MQLLRTVAYGDFDVRHCGLAECKADNTFCFLADCLRDSDSTAGVTKCNS